MKDIIEYGVTDAALAELKEQYSEVPDCTQPEGYNLVRTGIGEVRTLRTSVEKKRKELKADALAWGRKVDGEAKRITGVLVAIENPMKAAKEAVDNAEKARQEEAARLESERIDDIQDRIQAIKSSPGRAMYLDAEHMAGMLKYLEEDPISVMVYQEFEPEAQEVVMAAIRELSDMHEKRLAFEEEQGRQAAQKKAQAEAQAIIDAERKALDDARREQEAAQEAERKAIEDERRKVEAMKREQDERELAAKREQEAAALRVTMEKEAKEKAEREAQERAEREAREKAEREETARKAKEREGEGSEYIRAEEKPDKEKALAYASQIMDLADNRPEMNDPAMNDIMQNAFIGLVGVAEEILEMTRE